MTNNVPDVLIVGGGVIGLGLADTLARRGVSVALLERERVGGRASWAGAGMLNCRPPRHERHGEADYSDFILASIKLYDDWAARLLEETDINIGVVHCGALELFTHERLARDGERAVTNLLEGAASRGLPAQRLTPREALEREPALDISQLAAAVALPGDGQVRSPRVVKALALSCRQREVRIQEGVNVTDVWVENGKVLGVSAADGTRHPGGQVVICAGAWTGQFKTLAQAAPRTAKIHPVRGQIVCYQLPAPPCARLLTAGERYVVPRPDGIVLVGSTTEKVGFEAVTTPSGQLALREFGASLLPALKTLEPIRNWAELRPGLTGRHPLLGPVPGITGLFVAAGHYRNGLVLAPITAEIMAALVLKQPPPLPIGPYLPR